MKRKRSFERPRPGLPPGTLIHVGPRRMETAQVRLFAYDPVRIEEKSLDPQRKLPIPGDTAGVLWINVDGLHDTRLLASMGQQYGIHPLVLEDILNTAQRPKLEEADPLIFLVFKMVGREASPGELAVEQVSILLGRGLLLTFQERPGDVFEPVRERLRAGLGRIRGAGADYLAYALLDVVVDRYFDVLEQIHDRIEKLEDRLLGEAGARYLEEIHRLRRELSEFRQLVWPLRESLSRFKATESPLVSDNTRLYLLDLYDHVIQVLELIESSREAASGLLDLYMSVASNRMNEVMKLLTVIATLFIPVTFLAGIYGMNFHFMPELEWTWSYPLFWLVTLGVLGGMIRWFRKKGWL